MLLLHWCHRMQILPSVIYFLVFWKFHLAYLKYFLLVCILWRYHRLPLVPLLCSFLSRIHLISGFHPIPSVSCEQIKLNFKVRKCLISNMCFASLQCQTIFSIVELLMQVALLASRTEDQRNHLKCSAQLYLFKKKECMVLHEFNCH